MEPYFPSRSDLGRWHAHSGSGQPELYFSYGNNMAIEQMAEHCPRSVFLGAVHPGGFRWQVNQRGVANIVPVGPAAEPMQATHMSTHSPSYIEGLVYSVKPTDVQSVDRSEGVRLRLYEKEYVPVEIHDIGGHSGQLCTQLAQHLSQQLAEAPGDASESGSPSPRGSRPGSEKKYTLDPTSYRQTALVYISSGYNLEGAIHSTVACGDSKCSHDSPVCDLRRENRRPHRISGTSFDDAIFAWLIHAKERAKSSAPASNEIEITRPKHNVKLVFVVVFEKPATAQK